MLRVLAATSAALVLAAACTRSQASPADSPTPTPSSPAPATASSGTVKIAFMGALSGPDSSLILPAYQSVQLLVTMANEGAFGSLPVTIELVGEDTQGLPDKAIALSAQIANDPSFIGVIGPGFSGESAAAGATLDAGGIPFVSASATNPNLASNGWAHWFQANADDDEQGPAIARYIARVLRPARCVFVASDDSLYGEGLASIVLDSLSGLGVGVKAKLGSVSAAQGPGAPAEGIAETATRAARSHCSVAFYGGYASEAGTLRRLMTRQGLTRVTLVGGDGIRDDDFGHIAGRAGIGTVAACPCIDPMEDPTPAAARFVREYSARWNQPPGIYAAEYWDVAQMYVAGLKAGKTTRQSLSDFVQGLKGFQGITKSYSFDSDGQLDSRDAHIYFYLETRFGWSFLGNAADVIPA
jgi:branched-chain amino acid transport system substrate-binding protein